MKTIKKDVLFWLGEDPYHVEIYNDHEIRFRYGIATYRNGFICDEYERVTLPFISAVRLFKTIVRIVVQYLWEEKPPLVYFTAGWDSSRFSLYKKLALRLEAYGYDLAYDETRPNIYYAYCSRARRKQ